MKRYRILIGVVLLAVAAALVVYRLSLIPPDYAGRSISVEQAHELASRGELVLIDIRRPEEWKRTGIPAGASPLDMRRPDFQATLAEIADADRSRPIALICARGVRSARMAQALSAAGYTDIIDVPEGMLGSAAGPGWLASNLPVTPIAETPE
ncbi:rhodanese-like domain-containing protein [Sedimentitalea sp. XS_ASV28]|uniref:rhodanese-like domain-containing protein n=1 Tax=Sedimentitalea sp. XS_ASV28 TaxID=3241296 RepID=UPI00351986B6